MKEPLCHAYHCPQKREKAGVKRKCAYPNCVVANEIPRKLVGENSIQSGENTYVDHDICRQWRTRWQEKTTRFSITSEIMTFNALTHSQNKAYTLRTYSLISPTLFTMQLLRMTDGRCSGEF